MAFGKLLLFTGPMRSGKSTARNSILESALDGGLKVALFRPPIDVRDPIDVATTRGHYQVPLATTLVASTREMLEHALGIDVVSGDEIQFWPDEDLAKAAESLYLQGKFVVLAGLDLDWRGVPFEVTRDIMALPYAKVIKKRAVCVNCQSLRATHTQKRSPEGQPIPIASDSPRFEVGDAQYVPLCAPCWFASTPGALERRHLVYRSDPGSP